MKRTSTGRLPDTALHAVKRAPAGRMSWHKAENLHIKQIEAAARNRAVNLSQFEQNLVQMLIQNVKSLPFNSTPKNALQFFFSTAKTRLMNYGSTWIPPPSAEKIRILQLKLSTPRNAKCDLADVREPDKPALHVYYFDEEACDIGKCTLEFSGKNKFRLGAEKICQPHIKSVQETFPELPPETIELANDLIKVSKTRTA